jgi:predicted ATP-binding protein involved in virulence
MLIQRLCIENYRGFRTLELNFELDVTVLVGVNGAGKSSLLDAIAVMLSDALYRAAGERPRSFADLDIRAGEASCWAELKASLPPMAVPIAWSTAHARKGSKRTRSVARGPMMQWVDAKQAERSAGRFVTEPIAVYYPTERTLLDVPGRVGKKHTFTSVDALAQALEPRTVDFRLFFEWFREREDIENERRAREDPRHRDPGLEAVRSAIEAFMPDFRDPRVQRSPQRFVVTKRGVVLEVDQLSDGERSLLALVGDLARRLSMVSPVHALKHPAVVLIDEIEIHLHPAAQRDLIARFRRTFPNVQLVLTTHSPYALGEVPARCVRLLRDFQIEAPTIETEGQSVSVISTEVQGASVRPRAVESLLVETRRAIDENDRRTAERTLSRLKELVGDADPDVIRLDAFLDLLVHEGTA